MRKLDKYSDRRIMPEIVIPSRTLGVGEPSILASGDLNYFIKFGLPLIKSHIINGGKTGLIINCVDFEMQVATDIMHKYFDRKRLSRIFLTKTNIKKRILASPDQNACFLRTIRFHVARLMREQINIDLLITDIDALITKKDFSSKFQALCDSDTTFAVGAIYDFFSNGLFESSKNNFLWRTIKAGFSYYSHHNFGLAALKSIDQYLFNTEDLIPPIDDLKLYRTYYGDQLAMLFTSLELNAANDGNIIKCLGHRPNDLVTFSGDPNNGSMWIPPASKRNSKYFQI